MPLLLHSAIVNTINRILNQSHHGTPVLTGKRRNNLPAVHILSLFTIFYLARPEKKSGDAARCMTGTSLILEVFPDTSRSAVLFFEDYW